jgi:membrane dipeptidase
MDITNIEGPMDLTPAQEERARRLHEQSLVLLAHDHYAPPDDVQNMLQGGVTAKILLAVIDARVWSSDQEDYQRSIPQVEGWFAAATQTYKTILEHIHAAGNLALVCTTNDVLEAKKQGKIGILLGAEGGKLIEYDIQNLTTLYSMGLRHILLSWAFNNQLTKGELDCEGGGLTPLGREVVGRMNELGMIVDITHISRPAMQEVLQLSSRPVLNSHSTLKSISSRIPAMTEAEIRQLADSGGVIALHFMTHMLTGRFEPRATLEEMLRQIDAIVKIGGIECLALGPDYLPYTDEFKRNTGQPHLTFPIGLETTAQLPNLTRALVWHGYSDDAIEKILGKNLFRLFSETIDAIPAQ